LDDPTFIERHFAVDGIDVPCRFFLPEPDGRDYSCRVEIDWPDRRHAHRFFGVDSVQALQLAMQSTHAYLLASPEHKEHRLTWHGERWLGLPSLPGFVDLPFTLDHFDLDAFVSATLAEDLGGKWDVTSHAVIPYNARFDGVMDSREAITVAGLAIAEAFFRKLDPEVEIQKLVEDGDKVPAGTNLMRLSGLAAPMLTAERSALNTVQHLSGIATLTRRYVDAIAGTGAILLDTRKTIPGLRVLEKYATRMGGAQNHRMGLWDAAMIKDNHVAVAGSVGEAVRRAVAAGIERIIVEVDRLDQIEPAIAAGATHLLLDNMGPAALREAVAEVAGRVPTEASGGINLETIRVAAETGVTYISVGRLTQSAPAADIGLDFKAVGA
jgi:nicotinate-nucleotide pyrophosphorylase (carboxylating)